MESETEDNAGNLAGSTGLSLTSEAPTIWGSANYARSWFDDARAEVETGPGADSRRREIIFSVCFLESYLFEWVRSLDVGAVDRYFPTDKSNPNYSRKIKQKWKEIPNELFEDGLIDSKPTLDFADFGQLLRNRNGLIHAEASRPFNSDVPEGEMPYPERDKLEEMKPGSALEVAKHLVLQLHDGTNTKTPDYLR